jgi:hypothetical protein
VWQPGELCPDPQHLGVTSTGKDPSITDYIAQANAIRYWWSLYGVPNDEIWITETGCLNAGNCPAHNTTTYINAVTDYLNDDGRWIDRYAWFTDVWPGGSAYTHTSLMNYPMNGTLTGIGTFYSHIVPAAHIPGFQYLVFLPVVLNENSGGAMMVQQVTPFVSPLPMPGGSTFQSPLPIPVP